MLVSFLVPVYNTKKYLRKCIDSLLVQQGAPFEIVLINDGATDECPKICDEYQTRYPEIIRVIHKENEGLLLTRRRGFREARGDWFICIDSDDYAADDLLESVVETIKKHEGCDMVMYNYYYVNDQGETSPSRLKLKDGSVYSGENKQELYAARLTTNSINNMWLRAVRRDIVDIEADYSKLGLKNMCEDAVQVLPLYTNAKKTVYIDKPLYYYRKSDGSITSNTTMENWRAIHRSFALEQDYLSIWNVSEDASRERYTKQLENICNCFRWLYNNPKELVGASGADSVRRIKEEAMFRVCADNYDKKYISSNYNRLSLPIITMATKHEFFALLKCYFKVEQWLLKGKR